MSLPPGTAASVACCWWSGDPHPEPKRRSLRERKRKNQTSLLKRMAKANEPMEATTRIDRKARIFDRLLVVGSRTHTQALETQRLDPKANIVSLLIQTCTHDESSREEESISNLCARGREERVCAFG